MTPTRASRRQKPSNSPHKHLFALQVAVLEEQMGPIMKQVAQQVTTEGEETTRANEEERLQNRDEATFPRRPQPRYRCLRRLRFSIMAGRGFTQGNRDMPVAVRQDGQLHQGGVRGGQL